MYDVDGAFGRVRKLEYVFSEAAQEAMPCLSSAGWHECNELYRIARPGGGDSYTLFFTMRGEGRAELEGRTEVLECGSIAVIPPACPIVYYTPAERIWNFYWLHPQGNAARRLLEFGLSSFSHGGAFILRNMNLDIYAKGIERMILLKEQQADSFVVRACGEVSAILYRLIQDTAGAAPHAVDQLSLRIIQYMEDQYARSIPIAELSQKFYLSGAHIIRRFKQETGYTPHEYLNRVRIQKAVQLLHGSDMTVEEIAYRVGFHRSSHFIQLYRRYRGITPGEDRL